MGVEYPASSCQLKSGRLFAYSVDVFDEVLIDILLTRIHFAKCGNNDSKRYQN